MQSPYGIVVPKERLIPILLSCPHSGTAIPQELAGSFKPKFVSHPEDTDWFVDRLYDFASDIGVTTIRAHYSRYVVDLNRNPHSEKLYADSRAETALVPVRSFAGEELYQSESPTEEEIEQRREAYYWPYYRAIESVLADLKKQFRHVLFFDAHSIKRSVPSIHGQPFPDLILGNQGGKTAHPKLIESARSVLDGPFYSFSENFPFQGGQLTRYFGNPDSGIHALQLEMSQEIYMDEGKCEYSQPKADKVRKILRETLLQLGAVLNHL